MRTTLIMGPALLHLCLSVCGCSSDESPAGLTAAEGSAAGTSSAGDSSATAGASATANAGGATPEGGGASNPSAGAPNAGSGGQTPPPPVGACDKLPAPGVWENITP